MQGATVKVKRVAIVAFRDLMLSTASVTKVLHLPPQSEASVDTTPMGKATVDAVLEEATQAHYFSKVNRPGNRASHYKHRTYHGTTAVISLRQAESWVQLQHVISGFQEDVEKELPNMFYFFDQRSLHITVRGLWKQAAGGHARSGLLSFL